jgi:predicted nuclease of restriction endonuclease-like (RecB) superfamily
MSYDKLTIINDSLINDVRTLIEDAKSRVARVINSEMTMLYWNIGKRIKDEILNNERAEYGEQVVKSLALKLSAEYGRGFSRVSLIRMIQFYDYFSNVEISSTLSNQLTWSHIIELLPLQELNQREFYTYMAIHENWSVRELRSKIYKMTYERTIGTQKSGESETQMMQLLKNENQLNLDSVLKDPLVLDFLHLPDDYTENDLENAILKRAGEVYFRAGNGICFCGATKTYDCRWRSF